MKLSLACSLVLGALVVASRARAENELEAVPSSPDVAQAPPDGSTRSPEAKRGDTGAVLASGGASARSLYGLPVLALDVGGAVGVERRHGGYFFSGRYELGETLHGLSVHAFRLGFSAEAIFDRIRLGGGLDVVDLGFRRATDRSWVDEPGVGAFVFTSVDLVQLDRHALFVGLRGDVDTPGRGTVGGALVLGFRL